MIRTFIYGSCVSRDTFEFLRPHGYELVHYVARQSLISAMAPGDRSAVPIQDVRSQFQRRMLAGDWKSSLSRALTRHSARVDLLLWDLCDERLGAHELPGGRFVTKSVDSITSGLDQRLGPDAQFRPFGSPDHQAAFAGSLAPFKELLTETGLIGKTVLLAPPWAQRTSDASKPPRSFGRTATDANPVFSTYHQLIADRLGVPVISLPAAEVVAAHEHRWGMAPFHYTEDVYRTLTERIREVAELLVSR